MLIALLVMELAVLGGLVLAFRYVRQSIGNQAAHLKAHDDHFASHDEWLDSHDGQFRQHRLELNALSAVSIVPVDRVIEDLKKEASRAEQARDADDQSHW